MDTKEKYRAVVFVGDEVVCATENLPTVITVAEIIIRSGLPPEEADALIHVNRVLGTRLHCKIARTKNPKGLS